MGSRHSRRRTNRNNKALRGNEGHTAKTSTQSITAITTAVPEGSDLWDQVTPQELRDLINRYGHFGLRFPAKVVVKLLDEISRLGGDKHDSGTSD
ncbi:hypothetical protein AAC03nite_28390 [Alicyclobacillus acidoterrestris]|nr:hypothetical protein AAC03nite_28390 [Alicyclobacillus acidoterrestris]